MFVFDLPENALLSVQLPTGGTAVMVHHGDGRFLSRVPPVMLAGVSLEAEATHEGLPIGWDGTSLPGDSEAVHPVAFVFDAVGAQRAVEAAAAGGDRFAGMVMDEIRAAEAQLDARQAVGMAA